jgi:ketosteroid isomerase-like protein
MTRATCLILISLSVLGAGPLASSQSPEAVLLEADAAFDRQTAEEGLKGWLAWFAPNAAVFPPSGPVVRGTKGVRAYYEGLASFPPPGFGWTPDRGGMAASGDLGWTVGGWAIEGTEAPGGRYLSIWGQQEDGSWRVVADCGGSPDFRADLGLDEAAVPEPEAKAADWVTFRSADGGMVVRGGVWSRESASGEERSGATTGKALVVFVRGEDGDWEIAAETGFPHPPEAPAEP